MTNLIMRMPPMAREVMNDAQRIAADELIAGPRKGVKGPFIALLRSPDLMGRLQKVGEYLRFDSKVPARLSEFATLIVSRDWSQQFEWFTHVPLALKAGVNQETIDSLREGRRPSSMATDEALAYDFTAELTAHRGVCEKTYNECVERFGEQGIVDLVCIIGYFTLISMVLNVAHIPEEPNSSVAPLQALPR